MPLYRFVLLLAFVILAAALTVWAVSQGGSALTAGATLVAVIAAGALGLYRR